jgi:sulfonate transport system substrate-binding protein
VASDAAIAGRRPELEDFLRRYRQASAWAAAHPDEYAAMLSQETGLPLDVATVTASRNRGVPVPLDESIVAEERRTLETFVRAGIIDKSPDLAGAFDASFNWAEAAVR